MFKSPNAITACGIYYFKGELEGAIVSLQKGKPKIERAFKSSNDVKPLDISGINPDAILVSGLPASEVLVRQLEINLTKKKDVDAVFEFQAEPLLPFPADTAIMERIWLSSDKESTYLTLLATKKDHLQVNLDKLAERNILPEIVSCVPVALATFSKFYSPAPELPLVVVHIGHAATTCALVKEGKLIASNTIPMGILQINAGTSDPLRQQIERSVYALSKQLKTGNVENLLVCGENASTPNLANALCGQLKMNVISPEDREMCQFAIPVGLALDALTSKDNAINFRKQEFVHPDRWKRLKKPLMTFGALSIGLAAAFYLFGISYLNYQEDKVKENYIELLASMSKTYEGFENEIAAKRQKNNNGAEEPTPIALKDFTQEQVQERLDILKKELESTPDSFPLQPNTARVSDILAWFSNHPKVIGEKDKKDSKSAEKNSAKEPEKTEEADSTITAAAPNESNPAAVDPTLIEDLSEDLSDTSADFNELGALIQLESFNYTMVKRPEQTKKQDKYQVKVEMEFSTATPKIAREFHDALISPNDFIDPKGEIKWNSNRGKYRTSFYLKDKTHYPQ